MRGSGDIISLSSRAHLRRPPVLSHAPEPRAPLDRRPGDRPTQLARAGLTLLVLTGAMLMVGLAIGEWDSRASVAQIPSSIRTVEYARALDDAERTCTTPAARQQGALHQHCIDQAQFLLLFPECDARCHGVTNQILPRARR